jgi:hypothetical protein
MVSFFWIIHLDFAHTSCFEMIERDVVWNLTLWPVALTA